MQPTTGLQPEKLELDSLLASGIFNRAPNLALVLKYICSKYFEGGADQIKEYNIAVEALGRGPDFDQRGDSIVRVEAHRLRKRLREYYEGEGAGHAVQIEIPPGQYAPRFIFREPWGRAEATAPEETGAIVNIARASPAAPAFIRVLPKVIKWAFLAVALAIAVTLLWRTNVLARTHTAPPWVGAPALLRPDDTIRILCGLERSSYIDHSGNTWSGDTYFQGGQAIDAPNHPIHGTPDPRLYRTRREGSFHYDIPLKPGVYELRLHFAETVYGDDNAAGGGETSRVFSVQMNGKEALRYLDVVADGGASTADVKVFKDVSPAEDGKLHLQFDPISNQPILSAIEIAPGLPGHMRAVRMVAQDHAYTDKNGRYWEPDRYVRGGLLAIRHDGVSGTPDPDLYRGERFGNITYAVPVSNGRYRITLHFAETWFGPGKAGGGPGPGSRIFDIFCNGEVVRRNFDIFKEAGGADRAITLAIPDVTPNHQGKLVVSLVPANNYACVNAIEVVDESR
jgi:Malectin domain